MSSVTLAIPCFRASATLPAVLAAVERLRPRPDALLLVDDGSDDHCGDLARQRGFNVVRHGDNRGLAAARNTALREAATDLVLFVDADAAPRRDLVQRLTRHFDDSQLAAAGGEVVEQPGSTAADRWRANFWRQTQGAAFDPNADFVVGACCCLRRQLTLDAGGFTGRFRTNGEDVELSLRLRRRGYHLAYDPEAQVVHQRHDDPWSLASMVFRHSRDHVLALRAGGSSPAQVVRNAVRWGPVTLVSSLRRHRDPAMAALSPLCYGAALAGCLRGLTRSP